jgi:hypothetical protein
MDLSTLLGALNQGFETGVISRIESALSGQTGSGLSGQTGPEVSAQTGSGLPAQSGASLSAQTAPGLSAQTGASLSTQAASAGSLQQQTSLTNLPVTTGSADVYYGSGAPASPNLLAQSGVNAYIQLLNALSTTELDEKSAQLLTSNLATASATLRSAYSAAVATLPLQLQQEDWGFSVSNGNIVFTQGKDALSAQDLATLQKAFSDSNVQSAARQVANAIISIDVARKSGADAGSLALGQSDVDESDLGEAVNLRTYVTATAPGGNYNPSPAAAATTPQIPNILGGMDLRGLVSARPNFFRANGSVTPDPMDDSEAPEELAEDTTLVGRCACGEVHFAVENAFEYAYYCHCSRCRLRTGSAFAAIAGIGIDKIHVTAGHEHLLIEGECSDGYGARCSRCYAFLFAAVRNRQYMHVSLGALAGTPGRLPDHHIYVGSKAPWYQITDALPQYDESPGG